MNALLCLTKSWYSAVFCNTTCYGGMDMLLILSGRTDVLTYWMEKR
jgi:hypothetical protein